MRVVDKDGEVYKVIDLTNNKVDEVQPWKNLRLNVKLHQYLRANNLAELVPKGY